MNMSALDYQRFDFCLTIVEQERLSHGFLTVHAASNSHSVCIGENQICLTIAHYWCLTLISHKFGVEYPHKKTFRAEIQSRPKIYSQIKWLSNN